MDDLKLGLHKYRGSPLSICLEPRRSRICPEDPKEALSLTETHPPSPPSQKRFLRYAKNFSQPPEDSERHTRRPRPDSKTPFLLPALLTLKDRKIRASLSVVDLSPPPLSHLPKNIYKYPHAPPYTHPGAATYRNNYTLLHCHMKHIYIYISVYIYICTFIYMYIYVCLHMNLSRTDRLSRSTFHRARRGRRLSVSTCRRAPRPLCVQFRQDPLSQRPVSLSLRLPPS